MKPALSDLSTFGMATAISLSALFGTAAVAQSNDVSTTINGNDHRIIVPLTGANAAAFNAVGILNGGGIECTATIVEFQGYEPIPALQGRPLVLTAAHCATDGFVGQMTFHSDRVGYTATVIDGEFLRNYTHDIAILALDREIPDEIIPALVLADYPYAAGQSITAIGYAAERREDGLLAHVHCSVEGVYVLYVASNCRTDSGTSGGPMATGINYGQLIVGGVINGFLDYSQLTTYDTIPAYFLDDSYFLIPNNGRSTAPGPFTPMPGK